MRPVFLALVALAALLAQPAHAADPLRLALQATGTTVWEMAVVSAYGLDKEAGLDLKITELASPEAGKIALMGGSADVIVSDWLWVARERAGGHGLAFSPVSTGIGAVMTKDLAIKSVKDLAGKKLGVAGGPLDKSWLLLKAHALRQGVDLEKAASIVYGAPPLLAEKAAQGEIDAVLEFWNFATDLEARGFRRAIDMAQVERALGATSDPVVTGYVFDEKFATAHGQTLARFFAMMKKAKTLIATNDEAWAKAAPRVPAKDKATLDLYRKRYVEAFPKGSLAEQEADAAKLFAVLAATGGEALVGSAKSLPPGTFYKAAP
ncbi:ABC transporter substrate-binding protein [Methylocystis bryophila]|uniref:ABC transporter substrate-binding protein n=1 Tax=Methylocystis bryophila TaxID=655015 RepID=A0A1W6MYP0_9HYPH|nr:ABC transporter substrate-binding protein [Methylocystis bryophila]ARN82701.1 ABC transporter substrate-binding protein [Methylocystis bryophila]BDV38928.1 ABC transporter substrate-binding protein [Methylocystis bryophila]